MNCEHVLFSLLAVLCMHAAGAAQQPAVFYVAANGTDAWTGTFPEPNGAANDGPFATLARARDAVRALKQAEIRGHHPNGVPEFPGVVVWVRGGRYFLAETFVLSAEDSGTASSPILYAAYPGEKVVVSGGRDVKDWSPVTDVEVLRHLSEDARKEVRRADLKALGISDFGPPDKDGLEVFFMDAPMTLARWPDEGFVRIRDIAVDDGHKIHGIPGSTVGKFYYDGERPSRWTEEKDPWVHGYWFWDWSEQRQRIAKISPEQSLLELAEPYHGYGYRKGQWYYAFNLLSELDRPGEWYLDREAGVLYFWPTAWLGSSPVEVSVLPALVTMTDAAYVGLRGFTFVTARGTAVQASNVQHAEISDCIVRNVGGGGISLSGKDSRVAGCEIYQVGGSGISLSGGNRDTLEASGLCAENNHIHHYGRIARMYSPGIGMNGVGIRVANNLIHSAPHIGIMFGGNDHVIEYNELHHVCEESNDAGAMYAGRNWTMRGNVIRYNYLHHIQGFENRGCVGVYLDDMFASAAIYGNIFYRVTRAAFIGGGRDCSIENNIFVACDPALHVDARALNWAGYHADTWIAEAAEKGTVSGIPIKQPPYCVRYPELLTLLEDEPKAPKGNRIARNICWGGKWDDIEGVARPYLQFGENLIQEDPHFVDADKLDFRLESDSPAFAMGFAPIPSDNIGLYGAGPGSASAFGGLYETAAFPPALSQAAHAAHALCLARQARERNAYAPADAWYARALEAGALSARDRWNALLERGHAAMGAGRYAAAREVYGALSGAADAPPEYKGMAAMRIGESHLRERNYAAARAAFAAAAALPGVPAHFRWEADDRTKEADCLERGVPYERVQTSLPELPESDIELFVATSGNDANPGSLELPLATFDGARRAVRALNEKGAIPPGGVAVNFRGGDYPLRESVRFDAGDSGTAEAPIVYRAYLDEAVRFTAGIRVTGFSPVTDAAILERLPDAARDKVVQADLKALGVAHLSALQPRGFGWKEAPPIFELFVDGKPLRLARWPNEGFVRTGAVTEAGSFADSRGAVFAFDGERPARWTQAPDVWLYGYWYYDWADSTLSVSSINLDAKRIATHQTSSYTVREGQPYFAFNLLEEIDEPGEYYLDRTSGIVYVYPPAPLDNACVEASLLEEPLLALADTSHVSFQRLTFELGQGYGVTIRGGASCLLAGCTLRKLGGTGVLIDKGRGHGVFGCDLETLGRRGIELFGGDRATLEASGHFVENCHVHDFSRIDRTYTPAVQVEGVGNRVAYNRFNDSPCHAMRVEGNDHLIEFNEVDHVVRESDDQGGVDIFLNVTYRGNVLRYNYWHDIGSGRACGQAGIRLDDAISGTLIYGNVFARCAAGNFGGVQIHGGKDNWVDNNLFVDCPFAVSSSSWGVERWRKFIADESTQTLLREVNAAEPPYSTRYPELARLDTGPDVNNIWRNLAVNSVGLVMRDPGCENLVDNCVTAVDPGFLDAEAGDFRIEANAAVFDATGFREIPFKAIGLFAHPLRASWPPQ